MDLVGLPYQIIVGPKGLEEGFVELKYRATNKVEKHNVDEIASWILSKAPNS